MERRRIIFGSDHHPPRAAISGLSGIGRARMPSVSPGWMLPTIIGSSCMERVIPSAMRPALIRVCMAFTATTTSARKYSPDIRQWCRRPSATMWYGNTG